MADETVLRRLVVALGVKDADKTVKALKTVKEQGDKLAESWGKLATTTAKFFAGLSASAGLLTATALATARDAEAIERRSRALAVSQERYQRLLAVFEQYGAEGNDVADVLGTLADRAEDAKGGMTSFVDDFKLVGVTVDELKGKKPDELFDLFADAIARSEDPNKALTAAVRILGDDVGNKLLPMLQLGSAGINGLADDAERLGVVMSEDAVKGSADLARSWRQLKQLGQGLMTTLGVELAPVVKDLVDQVRDWALANGDLLRTGIQRWVERLRPAVDTLAEGVRRVNRLIEETVGYDGAIKLLLGAGSLGGLLLLGKRLYPVLDALMGIWKALKVVALSFGITLTPLVVGLTVLAAVIAGVALMANDLWVTIQGGDSLMGRFIERFKESDGVVGGVARVLGVSMRAAKAFFTIITYGAPLAWQALKDGLGIIGNWLMQFKLVQGAAFLFGATIKGYGIIFDEVSGKVGELLDGFSSLFTDYPLSALEGAAANLSGTPLPAAELAVAGGVTTSNSSSVVNNNQSTSSSQVTINATGMPAREIEALTASQQRQAALPTRGGIR